MPKHFLPRETFTSVPLVNEHTTDASSSSVRSCCKRFLPLVGMLIIISGSIFLGLSIAVVGDGQVGFYAQDKVCIRNNCTVPYIGAGLHIEWPWKKGLKVITIKQHNTTIGNIRSSDGSETLRMCMVETEIANINIHLLVLINFESEQSFKNVVQEELREQVKFAMDGDWDIVSGRYALQYRNYGMRFGTLFFDEAENSKPVLKKSTTRRLPSTTKTVSIPPTQQPSRDG